jgi:sortase A
MLGYCGFAVADTWMFQHRATESFELLRAPEAAAPVLSGVPSGVSSSVPSDVPPSVPSGPAAGSDGLIGRMAIQRLGVSVVVVEGTSNHLLRRAVGHIMGTALPGQSGNVGIAGHRDTFFRPLRNIQRDDIITIATVHAEYRYRVVSIAVVKPDNLTVLNSAGNETLTLVTCYPFYFVGYAPDRFIVRAERVI